MLRLKHYLFVAHVRSKEARGLANNTELTLSTLHGNRTIRPEKFGRRAALTLGD